MIFQRGGCVYILTNIQHTVLYVGVTSDLPARIKDHIDKKYPNSFSSRYNCKKLVYFVAYATIEEAIAAEKILKGGSKQTKIKKISELNPQWRDLYEDIVSW